MALPKNLEKNPERDYGFWKDNGGVAIVWSNPDCSDSIMILNALLKCGPDRLLAIGRHFGIDRLRSEWETLKNTPDPWPEELLAIKRAEPRINLCLKQLQEETAHPQ